MGTQLILLVGTNPLPIWVAWFHLKGRLPKPVKVRFVHTEQTQEQKNRLVNYMKDHCCFDPCSELPYIETVPADPSAIHAKIKEYVTENMALHVHYTGGTKAMDVETVSTLELGNTDPLPRSYLDPGRIQAPTIFVRGNTCLSPPLPDDARKEVKIKLEHISELNGFEIGPFQHTYWDRQKRDLETVHCPCPDENPAPKKLTAGQTVLNNYMQEKRSGARGDPKSRIQFHFREIFTKKDSPWKGAFVSDDKFIYPDSGGVFDFWAQFCAIYPNPDNRIKNIWKNDILPALSTAYPHCKWSGGKLCYPGKRTASEELQHDMEEMHDFLINSKWLEYAAYKAFNGALTTSKEERKNFKLFCNVHVRRLHDDPTDTKVRPFELDVVAVLGYQIVVVSCTVSTSPDMIKQKGMEAITRARQLGGDEARAIVLCAAHPNDQKYIEAELQDETGSSDLPLQIWGRDKWNKLSYNFNDYLQKKLYWINR